MAIDFTLTEAQQELQANAQAFAEGVLRPAVDAIDRAADGWGSFLAGRETYREMARAGFTKSFIPVQYGGGGFSMIDLAIAAEELSRVDVNVPTTLLGSGLGLQPVIQDGTPEQKERFLRPFADDPEGDLLASHDAMLAARGKVPPRGAIARRPTRSLVGRSAMAHVTEAQGTAPGERVEGDGVGPVAT